MRFAGFTLNQIDALRGKLGLAPPPPETLAGRLEAFQRALLMCTPRVWAWGVLLAVNVFVYLLMVHSGVHPFNATPASLIQWGADFGPLVSTGEWQRPFVAMFLHCGLFHLLMNMWVLAAIGPLAERFLGTASFLVVYFAAGLSASVASLYWHPMTACVGASGAIFGVFGAILGCLPASRRAVPPEALRGLLRGGLIFIGINFGLGYMTPAVDDAGHLGGLVGGLVAGLILAGPPSASP